MRVPDRIAARAALTVDDLCANHVATCGHSSAPTLPLVTGGLLPVTRGGKSYESSRLAQFRKVAYCRNAK